MTLSETELLEMIDRTDVWARLLAKAPPQEGAPRVKHCACGVHYLTGKRHRCAPQRTRPDDGVPF